MVGAEPTELKNLNVADFGDNLVVRLACGEEIPDLQAIDKAARTRYAALPGLEFVADAEPISADRLVSAEVWVAQSSGRISGFAVLQPMDEMLYLANISVVPDASGRGIGATLLAVASNRAKALGLSAVTLATFRAPPWNGPWFRKQGFVPMPEERIGPGLRSILERHARSLDMETRETLWQQCA